MMNKVTFKTMDNASTYDSYSDLNLVLNSKEIEAPSPKTETIDIPGGDGELDFTEYFGEVKYKNRKITLNFTSLESRDNFLEHFSRLQNLLQGQKFKITFSDDSNFHYVGRVTINKWTANKSLRTFAATVNCEPYKYKQSKTIIVKNIITSGTYSYFNLKKSVVPKITTTNDISLTFGSSIYKLSAGTYTLPDFVFTEGNNTLTVTGSTTLTVEYQEGEL